jgi:hypothetical protein
MDKPATRFFSLMGGVGRELMRPPREALTRMRSRLRPVPAFSAAQKFSVKSWAIAQDHAVGGL